MRTIRLRPSLTTISFIWVTLLSLSATAQAPVDSVNPAATPVAFVYVTRTTQIDGFAAAASGKLTPVPGSPFPHITVNHIAGNGKYLFAVSSDGSAIETFSIEADGALKYATSTAVGSHEDCGPWPLAPLFLDHTGANLYLATFGGGLCGDEEYLTFRIESSTGALDYIGDSGTRFEYQDPLTVSANNKFAYGSDCIDFEGGYLDTFSELKRSSSGVLSFDTTFSPPTPKTRNAADFYCRSGPVADPANHLAVSLQAIDFNTSTADGPPQLATYTADSNGNLTTASTYENMPSVATGGGTMRMSPSGKLLAVGGQGFEIFHFNASSPITHYSGVLQSAHAIRQFAWDGVNHLYALGTGLLFVYTATPTSITEATGSPYSIPGAGYALVLYK